MKARALSPLLLVALASAALAGPACAQRRGEPGWIGISFELRSPSDKAVSSGGAVITDVHDGSPAAAAGIRIGDRLLAINDLRGEDDFQHLGDRLHLRAGDRVRLRVDRDGRTLDVRLRAAARPAQLFAVPDIDLAFDPDSMVEEMFEAMDSLRIHLMQTRARLVQGTSPPASTRGRYTTASRDERETVGAPFEYFIFHGEQHDSLRRAMNELNKHLEDLRKQQANRLRELRVTAGRLPDAAASDKELTTLRSAIEEVTRQSASLRSAMAEAARVTAGFEYALPAPAAPPTPGAPPEPASATAAAEPFRPLTPYLVGSNRVAGAQVVDLKPELAEYFQVAGGVLVIDVAPGTPADIAGLRPGDVVVRLDKVGVRSVEDLRFGVSQAPDTLPLTLVRQGSAVQVLLRRR